jgi:hypothetical protein
MTVVSKYIIFNLWLIVYRREGGCCGGGGGEGLCVYIRRVETGGERE